MDNHSSGDLSKIFNSAVSTVTGMASDIKAQVNEKIEHYLAKMDLVKREEFEVVKAMLIEARTEQELLKKRLEILEHKK